VTFLTEDIRLFEETKSSLLRYHSELQSSQAARLVGFAVALFTLIQTVQTARQNGLSVIFGVELNIPIPSSVGLLSFSAGIFILMLLIIRAIFRYAAIASLAQRLIELEPFHIEEGRSFHNDVAYKACEKFSKERSKLYIGLFPAIWFVRTGFETSKNENLKGLIVSALIGFVLTVVLLGLLW
jgi:hypothetical protein